MSLTKVGVPTGGIIMWSGAATDIPDGWTLCDGNDGAPDLQNKFVVGSGSNYASGDTGGSDQVTLTEAEMPSHNHTGSTNTTGSHSHGVGANDGAGSGQDVNYAHTGGDGSDRNLPTTGSGSHNHSLSIDNTGSDNAHENRPQFFAVAYIMKQ